MVIWNLWFGNGIWICVGYFGFIVDLCLTNVGWKTTNRSLWGAPSNPIFWMEHWRSQRMLGQQELKVVSNVFLFWGKYVDLCMYTYIYILFVILFGRFYNTNRHSVSFLLCIIYYRFCLILYYILYVMIHCTYVLSYMLIIIYIMYFIF